MLAVRPLPDVRGRGAAVDLARYKGKGAVWWHYHISLVPRPPREQIVGGPGNEATYISRDQRGGEIKSTNKEESGPGVRRTAVAIAARRLPLCACRARQTARY